MKITKQICSLFEWDNPAQRFFNQDLSTLLLTSLQVPP